MRRFSLLLLLLTPLSFAAKPAAPLSKDYKILEVIQIPSAPGYSYRVCRTRCNDRACELGLELLLNDQVIATAKPSSDDIENGRLLPPAEPGPAKRDAKIDMGGTFKGPAWNLGGGDIYGTTVSAGLPIQLDAGTTGVLLYSESEGDFIRRRYDLWVADIPQKRLRRLYQSSFGPGGPFSTEVRLLPATDTSPFRFADLYSPFESGTGGYDNADSFTYTSQAWNPASRKLVAAPAGKPEAVPLYATIAGSYPSAKAAQAVLNKWTESKCISDYDGLLVLSSSELPLLKPGLFVLGDLFFDEKKADAAAAKFGKCDATEKPYVKRAY